ncbi:MAG: BadF/BadG/BcrA/BcrD ATPase family protein [Devosia sp.]
MGEVLLAIDVGGSTSRAYLVDQTGTCLGHGRSRGGNPASNNPDFAASSMIAAVEAAVADAGGRPFDIIIAQIALAGPEVHVARAKLEQAFRRLGLSGAIVFAGDLLAMFASVTPAMDGYCVVAGTGAGAVRILGGEIDRVVDLAGWQLGDLGSGYWLGHEAAKAAAAEMEGRGAPTALTPALLDVLKIPTGEGGAQGRSMALRLFIDAIYALRPIELARFAPLVIAHRGDAIADGLLAQAERYLASDFAIAFDPSVPGPVVLGGGVIAHLSGLPGAIGEVIHAAGLAPDIRTVTDGSVGAIVLALRAIGVPVDATMLDRIAVSVAGRNARSGVSV